MSVTAPSAGSEASNDEVSEPAETTSPRRPWRFGILAVAIAVLVSLLLGYGAGLVTPILTRPSDSSTEAGFVRDMSTHHAQAVEMSMIVLPKSPDLEVESLAADIALTQQAHIGMMSTWLRRWKLNPTGSEPRMAWMPDSAGSIRNGLMPGMATPEQLADLREATGRPAEVLFLQLMLQHHLGGIHMAEAILDLSDDDDVTWLAESMASSQQKEIAAIQALLADLGVG